MNGGEPIDPTTPGLLAAAGRQSDWRPSALTPAYGLAENTLAVAIDDPTAVARTHEGAERPGGDRTDTPSHPFVVVGSPVAGTSVVVRTVEGAVADLHEVGEIEVAGRSVAAGYYDPEARETVSFDGNRILTGDLGFETADGLVVCGRRKEVLVVAGHNVYPQEVERSLASIPGVRTGGVAVVTVDESERFKAYAVLFETAEGEAEAVRRRVAQASTQLVGQRPAAVVVLAPGALPKTTSGKLQRSRCRDLLEVHE